MKVLFLKQNNVQNINLGPFLDPASDVTEEISLSITVELSKNGSTFAVRNSVTAPTHDTDGWYIAEVDDTDTNTLGRMIAKVHDAANHKPVYKEFYVIENDLFDYFTTGSTTIKANVEEIKGDSIRAIQLRYFLIPLGSFTVDDSTFTPTSTQFEIKTDPAVGTAPVSTPDYFNGQELKFTAGANGNKAFRITDYDGTNKRITIDPAAPDTILNNHRISIGGISSLLDAPASIIWNSLIPDSIGLGDTLKLGVEVSDSTGDRPITAEITEGTIRIQRRGLGDPGFTEIVAVTPITDIFDGIMTFSESFTTAAGYFEGDTIEITLAGQKVTIDSTDHDLTSVGGNVYYTEIRHTIPQKFKDVYENAPYVRISVDVVTTDGDFTVQAETGYSLSSSNDSYNGVWLVFEDGNNDGVSRFISDYTGTTKRVQFLSSDGNRDSPFPNAVVTGDKGFIIGHR